MLVVSIDKIEQSCPRAGDLIMTLEQLRIFVAVAEREHVTLGAQDLNLTQSAASAAITALEARYAAKLFDRVGRRIVLTEAGQLFLTEAKSVGPGVYRRKGPNRSCRSETWIVGCSGKSHGRQLLVARGNSTVPDALSEHCRQRDYGQ
jgi:hypothetical protein